MATTKPTAAYNTVFLALDTFELSPFAVANRMPPITIAITDITPTAIKSSLDTLFIIELTLVSPSFLFWQYSEEPLSPEQTSTANTLVGGANKTPIKTADVKNIFNSCFISLYLSYVNLTIINFTMINALETTISPIDE